MSSYYLLQNKTLSVVDHENAEGYLRKQLIPQCKLITTLDVGTLILLYQPDAFATMMLSMTFATVKFHVYYLIVVSGLLLILHINLVY